MENISVKFLGKEYHFPGELSQYVLYCKKFQEMNDRLSGALYNTMKKIPIDDDGGDDAASDIEGPLKELLRAEGRRVISMLAEYGIFDVTERDLVDNNQGYKHYENTYTEMMNGFRHILADSMKQWIDQADNIQKSAYSQVTGTGISMWSNSIIAHMTLAAFETSTVKKQAAKADRDYDSAMDALSRKTTSSRERKYLEHMRSKIYPEIATAFGMFVNEMLDLFLSKLELYGIYSYSKIKPYDVQRSSDLLKNLTIVDNKVGVIEQAFKICPYNPEIYIQLVILKIVDQDAFDTAKVFHQEELIIHYIEQICIQYFKNEESISNEVKILSLLQGEEKTRLYIDSLKRQEQLRLEKIEKDRIRAEEFKKHQENEIRIFNEQKIREKEILIASRKKKLKIAIPCVVVVGIVVLICKVIKPSLDSAISYSDAKKLLENEAFDEAREAFAELNDYKDSVEMIKEASYREAEFYYNQGDYEESIRIWTELGDYSDSRDRVANVESDQLKEQYQEALILMESEKFNEASMIFQLLNGFMDSAEKYEECLELQIEVDYKNALDYLSKGEYLNTIKSLDGILDYKDADEIRNKAMYEYAREAADMGDYETAIVYFRKAGNYSDAMDRLATSRYFKACEALDMQNYEEAVDLFRQCVGYKDSESKMLDAKYGYVIQNKKSSFDFNKSAYLRELVEVNYPGAKNLYNELNKWTIDSVSFNSSKESSMKCDSINKFSTVYCHFTMGPEPVGAQDILSKETYVYYQFTLPDGSKGKKEKISHSFSAGESYFIKYPDVNSMSGVLSVKFYDEVDNIIGSGSVTITD